MDEEREIKWCRGGYERGGEGGRKVGWREEGGGMMAKEVGGRGGGRDERKRGIGNL